jgi:FkbM family methyltransferase
MNSKEFLFVKYWDENIAKSHVAHGSSIITQELKKINKEKIVYLDIGANVGSYFDFFSKDFEIEKCVMVEASPLLSRYLNKKFQDQENVVVYNIGISNEDKEGFVDESSLFHYINNEILDGMNLGCSNLTTSSLDWQGNSLNAIKIKSIFNFLKDDVKEYNFDLIKIDTENIDYLILESLKNYLKQSDQRPIVCFEHNCHMGKVSKEDAKKIYESFLSECGYDGPNFESLRSDILLLPKQNFSFSISKKEKRKIKIHNPCNTHTRYCRYYNLFWDKFTDHLKEYFDIEENRHFEFAHMQRFPVTINKGISEDFGLLECEYLIQNLENDEFVIMTVADDITHAAVNERENPLLKKTLISQFFPRKINQYLSDSCKNKLSPWIYFQSMVFDLEPFYQKRLNNPPDKKQLFFKGSSIEDRKILHHINKKNITDFSAVSPDAYFEEAIQYKVGVSIDGRGEFCYRDIEYMALGIPMIRYEYESKFYDPLIPNFHYISIPRPKDMDVYKYGGEEHAKILESRYYEVLGNEEYLNFVSRNARDYYEKNCEINANIKNTFELLDLKNWL